MAKNLPVGTHIVTYADKETPQGLIKRGTLGVVAVRTPDGVIMRLSDKREVAFKEEEVRSQRDSFRAEHVVTEMNLADIRPYIAFEFIAGSTAYGMRVASSDEDKIGAFILPTEKLFGMRKYQETIVTKKPEPDQQHHEIKKLMELASKGNPNVMELGAMFRYEELASVVPTHPLIIELLERWNELFMTKCVFSAYRSYSEDQFKKLETNLRNNGEIRWKHAAHLLRLLWSGSVGMLTGQIALRPRDHDMAVHNFLMDVRNGIVKYDEMVKKREEFEDRFQTVFNKCDLPDKPKFEEANDLLIRIRKSVL